MVQKDNYNLAYSPKFILSSSQEKKIDLVLHKTNPYKTILRGIVYCKQYYLPVKNATVEVFDKDFNPLNQTKTDKYGRYSFVNTIPPGKYIIIVSAKGFSISKSKTINIYLDRIECINFNLQVNPLIRKGLIYGTIKDKFTNKPLYNVQVILKTVYSKTTLVITKTNRHGQYIIYGIQPGNYVLYTKYKHYKQNKPQYIYLNYYEKYKCNIILDRNLFI